MAHVHFTTKYKGATDEAVFDDLRERNKALLRLFGRNNRYLRSLKKISTESQASELWDRYTFKTKGETIRLLEVNEWCTSSLFYLQMLSVYWNIPLIRLLTEDLSEGRS